MTPAISIEILRGLFWCASKYASGEALLKSFLESPENLFPKKRFFGPAESVPEGPPEAQTK